MVENFFLPYAPISSPALELEDLQWFDLFFAFSFGILRLLRCYEVGSLNSITSHGYTIFWCQEGVMAKSPSVISFLSRIQNGFRETFCKRYIFLGIQKYEIRNYTGRFCQSPFKDISYLVSNLRHTIPKGIFVWFFYSKHNKSLISPLK